MVDMDLGIVIKALTDTNDNNNSVRKEAERVLNEVILLEKGIMDS